MDKIHGGWELKLLTLIAVLFTFHIAKPVLFPLFLSFFLYLLLTPVVRILESFHIPKLLSSAIVTVSLIALIGFSFSYLVEPAAKWVSNAPQNFKSIEQKFNFIKKPIKKIVAATEKAKDLTEVRDADTTKISVEQPTISVFTLTADVMILLLTVFFLLFFLLGYLDAIIKHIEKIVFNRRSKNDSHFILNIKKGVSDYFIIYSLICALLGTIVGLFSWILGVPNPVLWGVMAMMLNFIPYIGPLIGIAVLFFVSLLTFDTFWQILMPPLLYLLCNILEGELITPLFLGKRLNLNPFIIFLMILIGDWMWGISGVLLSVPFLIILKITLEHLPDFEKYSAILEK